MHKTLKLNRNHGRPKNYFKMGFYDAKFSIIGTGTSEDAESKGKTAKQFQYRLF